MENKKPDPAEPLQVQLTVKPRRFKAGAELPTSVNLELDLSDENGFSVDIRVR